MAKMVSDTTPESIEAPPQTYLERMTQQYSRSASWKEVFRLKKHLLRGHKKHERVLIWPGPLPLAEICE